jgi:hypothetical protein
VLVKQTAGPLTRLRHWRIGVTSLRTISVGAVLGALLLAGCGGDSVSSRAQRSANVIDACRDNGGVAAFDDDTVICADQTTNDQRGAEAVDACRRRDGVSAFDDDIVICGDQSVHAVAGG